MVLLRAQDYQVMKWKNGRGKSLEIAIDPLPQMPNVAPGGVSDVGPNATFDWRLSVAEVVEEGEFSRYPGYDRFLTLVEGQSLRIILGEDRRKTLLRQGEVFRFSGDEWASCELDSGPVSDVGLIFRKDQVEVKFEVIELTEKPRSFQVEAKTVLIYGISGILSVELFPGKKVTLKKGDTLRIDCNEECDSSSSLILFEPKKSGCSFVFVEVCQR